MTDSVSANTVTVKTVEDWAAANELADDFADGVVKELALVGAEFVDPAGRMVYGEDNQLIVHAQMQKAGAGGTSARLSFAGVRAVAFDTERDVFPAIARAVEPRCWEVNVLNLTVVAEQCVVTLLGSSGLGEGPFLVDS